MASEEEVPIEMLLNSIEQKTLKIYEDKKLEFCQIVFENKTKNAHMIEKIANLEQKL
jgi:hypothetical protein